MKLDTYHSTVNEIVSLLKQNNIWYEIFEHEPVRTSEEAARVRTDYSIEQGAKALILKIDYKDGKTGFVQAVLPGDKKLHSKRLTKLLEAKSLRFARAEEINKITNGIEIGGIPPFGNLFTIPVFVDSSLLNFEKIIFNAGDRSCSIGMKLKDYLQIVQPIEMQFSKK